MKNKRFSLIIVLSLLLLLSGCGRQTGESEAPKTGQPLDLKPAAEIQETVNGWVVYTNPNYRYEFRHPKNWNDVEIDGKDKVGFLPADKIATDEYFGDLVMVGHVNIKKLPAEEYFQQEGKDNFLQRAEEKEDIMIAGKNAVRYNGVSGIYPDREVDIVLIDAGDRFLEIHLVDNFSVISTILSSIILY